MNVLHIIPSAFDYFDDIRSEAFALLDSLEHFGVHSEAFTVQYSSVNKRLKTEVGADTDLVSSPMPVEPPAKPVRHFMEMNSIPEMLEAAASFDVVHLHVPILGAARRVWRWKQTSTTPLVVSYYRPVAMPDLFSVGVMCYNMYYLPKLFRAAQAVTSQDQKLFRRAFGRSIFDKVKYFELSDSTMFLDQDLTVLTGGVQLLPAERLAYKCALLYQTLLT